MSVAKISKIKLPNGNVYQFTDNTKAPLDSAALIGTPTAPTPLAGDSSSRIATTAFVMAAIKDSIRITIINGTGGTTPDYTGLSATATTTLSTGETYSYTAPSNAAGIISIPVDYIQCVYTLSYSDIRVRGDRSVYVQSAGITEIAARYEETVKYTLRINENDLSTSGACMYMDDAVGMTKGSANWDNAPIFNTIRPCVMQNGIVQYYLNKNNFNEKYDFNAETNTYTISNTSSVLTGADGDVMIEVPKFGYRIRRDSDYLYVEVTNQEGAIDEYGEYCYDAFSRINNGDLSHFYQGAYKGYIDSSGNLRSIVGVQPTTFKTIAQFREAAQRRNTVNGVPNVCHYQQATYAHLVALQCLYLIKYGNRHGQEALGNGVVGADGSINTGGTETNGMCYGTTANSTTHVKLFGIEDFWGNIWEWIDGFWTDQNRNIITSWNKYVNGNSGEPVEESYTTTATGLTANASGWNKKVSGNSQTGFMPIEWGGSSTTYWADYGRLYASCVLYFGGQWYYGANAGPFGLDAVYGSGSSSRSIGGRLSYN